MCFLQTKIKNWKWSITRKCILQTKIKNTIFPFSCTSSFCAFHFLALFWHGGGGTIIACSHLTGTQNKIRVAHKFIAMAMENILQNHCFFSVAFSLKVLIFVCKTSTLLQVYVALIWLHINPLPLHHVRVCVHLSSVKGVLSLLNITIDTSGYYICTSANEIKSATCNMTLRVNPRKTHSSFSLRIDLKL